MRFCCHDGVGCRVLRASQRPLWARLRRYVFVSSYTVPPPVPPARVDRTSDGVDPAAAEWEVAPSFADEAARVTGKVTVMEVVQEVCVRLCRGA